MTTSKSNHQIRLPFVKAYGDAEVILGFYTTGFWVRLFKGEKGWLWSLFRDYIRFFTALSAFSVGVLLRYKHGSKTTGLIMSSCMLLWLVTLNSALIDYWLKPLFFLFSPLILLFDNLPAEYLIRINIKSHPLYWYTLIATVFAMIHTTMIYLGLGNTDKHKRGESYLHALVFKRFGCSERLTHIIVEPLFIAAGGYLSWIYQDIVFASFLWSGSFSMFLQEYLDYAWARKNASYF